MATSDVQIVNRALDKLGHTQPITSLTSDTSKAARLANRMFEFLRRKELSANYWTFARQRAQLAAEITGPAFGWTYAYQLPSDFLQLFFLPDVSYPFDGFTDETYSSIYEIESGKILTDEPAPLKIQYIADVTDPNLFHPMFAEALACLLAQEMCESLTQSNTKRQLAIRDYEAIIKEARYVDAIQQPPVMLPPGTFELSRF